MSTALLELPRAQAAPVRATAPAAPPKQLIRESTLLTVREAAEHFDIRIGVIESWLNKRRLRPRDWIPGICRGGLIRRVRVGDCEPLVAEYRRKLVTWAEERAAREANRQAAPGRSRRVDPAQSHPARPVFRLRGPLPAGDRQDRQGDGAAPMTFPPDDVMGLLDNLECGVEFLLDPENGIMAVRLADGRVRQVDGGALDVLIERRWVVAVMERIAVSDWGRAALRRWARRKAQRAEHAQRRAVARIARGRRQ